MDVAFLRREKGAPGVAFGRGAAGHPLAVRKPTRVHALAGETYISPAASAKSGDRELRGEIRCHPETGI
jgi:hypothetical protein